MESGKKILAVIIICIIAGAGITSGIIASLILDFPNLQFPMML